MSRRGASHVLSATLLTGLALGAGACSDTTGPGGDGNGNFRVELRNYTTTPRDMGLAGGTLVAVAGDVSSGTPELIEVASPGEGGTLDFVAATATDTLRATCTVTTATNVSERPQVVVQPAFNVLECVSW